MNHNKFNKLAWEEAFQNRKPEWGANITSKIGQDHHLFLDQTLLDELRLYHLQDKTVAQFCCNNGRELLSIYTLGASSCVGFDIAENMIEAANNYAKELDFHCEFVATDILDIDQKYYNTFDYIVVTTGALPWFQDLNSFFRQASLCLKKDGYLILHEMHPLTGMLPVEGETDYDGGATPKLIHSYFKQDPWVETHGMSYMSDQTKKYSETFFSYSHSFADIFNALIDQSLSIKNLKEFDIDFSGTFQNLSHKGIPLSYILIAQK